MALETINLEKWKFALGDDISCLNQAKDVTVPHTWNVEAGTEEVYGIGWYSYDFLPPAAWRHHRIRVLFHAVYHDAVIYLNGRKICVHKGSGYTPFTAELTDGLIFGRSNRLVVKVDNRCSKRMLPYAESFDWANDGGLIRPVQLHITGRSLIQKTAVTARPIITQKGIRQDSGYAVFGAQAEIDGEKGTFSAAWILYKGCDEKLVLIGQGKALCSDGHLTIANEILSDITYWHFDSPDLYTLKLQLYEENVLQDEQTITFGFREFCIQGACFYLNGEAIRLPGMEWMPGSDPRCGMAQTKEQIEKMLLCLKESNSVLTRFHWQQDDRVYDWCDRHGMLVQEEIPFWGVKPARIGKRQWEAFTGQMTETVDAHRNHPSIISWGVGNELNAQHRDVVLYIRNAVAYTHLLDPERPANYVTNTIYQNPVLDGSTDGDMIMVNDYIGTWHGDLDQYGEWDRIVSANPGKPLIPSEFGLCEPAFPGGDQRRTDIFLKKMECYRKYPNIAGTIYFCLNDYRTHMGEDGHGKLKQRIHGSADLYGNLKSSYRTVQREYSPLILRQKGCFLTLVCRNDIPSYTVKGYTLQIGENRISVPCLKPDEVWTTPLDRPYEENRIRLYRPNGDRVLF